MQIPVEIPGIPKKSPREMVPLSQAVLGRKCHRGTSRKTDGVTVGGRGRGEGGARGHFGEMKSALLLCRQPSSEGLKNQEAERAHQPWCGLDR